MRLALLATLGGGAGTLARYIVISAAARLLGSEFPWGTFAVNVAGSFAIGVLMAAIDIWFNGWIELRVFLVTGFLGGFTTFSAYSFDILLLIERKAYGPAMFYAAGSVLISLIAVALGLSAVRALVQ